MTFECEITGDKSTRLNNLILVKRLNEHIMISVFHERTTNSSFICEFDFKQVGQLFGEDEKCETNANADNEREFINDDENQDENYDPNSDILIRNRTLVSKSRLNLPYNLIDLTTNSLSECSNMIYLLTKEGLILSVMRLMEDKKLSSIKYHILYRLKIETDIMIDILVNRANEFLYLTSKFRIYQLDLKLIREVICNKNESSHYSDVLLNWCHTPELCSSNQSIRKMTNITKAITIQENTTHLLDCNLDHLKYTNSIKWFKDGNLIELTDQRFRYTLIGELIVLNSDLSHSGLYECRIDSYKYIFKWNLTVLTRYDSDFKVNNANFETLKTKVLLIEKKLNNFFNECSLDF